MFRDGFILLYHSHLILLLTFLFLDIVLYQNKLVIIPSSIKSFSIDILIWISQHKQPLNSYKAWFEKMLIIISRILCSFLLYIHFDELIFQIICWEVLIIIYCFLLIKWQQGHIILCLWYQRIKLLGLFLVLSLHFEAKTQYFLPLSFNWALELIKGIQVISKNYLDTLMAKCFIF